MSRKYLPRFVVFGMSGEAGSQQLPVWLEGYLTLHSDSDLFEITALSSAGAYSWCKSVRKSISILLMVKIINGE